MNIYRTTASTTKLSKKADLTTFRNIVNRGDKFSGQTVTLEADINLGGEEWVPIGHNLNYNFQGTFDGNSHKIYNFKITNAFVFNNIISPGTGFFGFMEKTATIQNLKISDAQILLSEDNANNDSPYG